MSIPTRLSLRASSRLPPATNASSATTCSATGATTSRDSPLPTLCSTTPPMAAASSWQARTSAPAPRASMPRGPSPDTASASSSARSSPTFTRTTNSTTSCSPSSSASRSLPSCSIPSSPTLRLRSPSTCPRRPLPTLPQAVASISISTPSRSTAFSTGSTTSTSSLPMPTRP